MNWYIKFITYYLDPLSYLCLFITFLVQNRFSSSYGRIILIMYSAVSFALSVGAVYIKLGLGKINTHFYDAILLESILFLFLYFYSLLKGIKRKKFVWILLGLNIAGYTYQQVFADREFFNSLGYSLLYISVIGLIFLYFHQTFRQIGQMNHLHSFDFWVVSGFVTVFFGGIFIMLTYYSISHKTWPNYAFSDTKHLALLWRVYGSFHFISFLTTLYGTVWIISRRKQH